MFSIDIFFVIDSHFKESSRNKKIGIDNIQRLRQVKNKQSMPRDQRQWRTNPLFNKNEVLKIEQAIRNGTDHCTKWLLRYVNTHTTYFYEFFLFSFIRE